MDTLLQGNGADMYDAIPNLSENDKELYSTGQKFWVGVIEGMYPSPPVPRHKTRCFQATDVYLYLDRKVFGIIQKNHIGEHYKQFYWIPEDEMKFIQ